MLDFEFKRYGNIGQLIFDGELTKERACELKVAIMVSLSNTDHLVVSLEKVSLIDDICACIFDIAQEKAEKLKKRIIFTGLKQAITYGLSGDAVSS